MSSAESRHLQVEGRVVDEDQRVRSVVQKGLPGNAEIILHILPVLHHSGKAHKRHVAYMAMQDAALRSHLVSSQTAYLRLGIAKTDLLNQRCGVHVAGSFACYDVVLSHAILSRYRLAIV